MKGAVPRETPLDVPLAGAPRGTDRAGTVTDAEVAAFREVIYGYYARNRRSFPWRSTRNPYHILVSEVMLQQTQTERVLGKYEQFLAEFPDFTTLAAAPLRSVMAAWQGLGYNRRALSLKRAAEVVVERYGGRLPSSWEILAELPGIGKATASAILAFAFNKPSVFIETNIRTVFVHFFFPGRDEVKDREIFHLVERTLDRARPRRWYSALMDYGVMLKRSHGNPSRRSGHHRRQSPFVGSNRQVRGKIIRALVSGSGLRQGELVRITDAEPEAVRRNLDLLAKEGLIRRWGGRFWIP
jgi:A/G-specific adenine glycosylase